MKQITGEERKNLVNQVMAAIDAYGEKHSLAVECGAEYVWQSDEAQVDALNLVGNIFDIYAGYYGPEEEEADNG